jgi:tripartite-type tricarboxylate transporter receptor subunit TctC
MSGVSKSNAVNRSVKDRKRRTRAHHAFVVVSTALTLHVPHAAAAADAEYPARPIRLIVPYAPGGAVDTVGRLLAQDLSPRIGQQVVVDNRAGGGGIIGMEIAARAAPDGYTLLVGSVGVASMPGLYRKLPFDPLRDFAPISVSITGTYLLGVNPSVAASSVKELITMAKQSPGKFNFGSSGAGSTIHLAGEMLKSMAGIDIVHVPYKSAGLAMTDVIAGNIQMMFAPVVVMQPMAKAGKVKALGVTSIRRSALAPEIPTIAEAALPRFEVSGWYGLLAPAATPRAVVNRLYTESKHGLDADSMNDRLKNQGLEVINLSPGQSSRFLKEDIARWSRVIRDANIKAE